jgi:TonB-linked SusC/RagA family outer membrane protein
MRKLPSKNITRLISFFLGTEERKGQLTQKSRQISSFAEIITSVAVLILFFLIPISGFSQGAEISVSGTVSSQQDGLGLPGVTIMQKGTTIGTVTDIDGRYKLTVDENSVLVFSYVGFLTQEINVDGQSTLNVELIPGMAELDEIVVVGYATQRKINLTGSVETVTSDKIGWKPVGQTSMALQGVVPGLTVTQSSGQPGRDGGTIRIRGIGTLGVAGQSPLILIDGIEGNFDSVNPNDIESISVLKDAAASSIYGSRAANGVILITTKRGGALDRINVVYNNYVGWQQPTDMPDVLGGLDHMLLLNEANINVGRTPPFSESYIEAYRQNSPSDLYPDTDWRALTMTNNGFTDNHNISIAGGTDFISVHGSVSSFRQNGLIPNTGYNRKTIRINTDVKANENLNFKFDLGGGDEFIYEPSTGVNTIFHAIYGRVPRNMPGVLSDGRYGEGWLGQNPISFANDAGTSGLRMSRFSLNLQADWQPIDGFNINFMYAPVLYEGYQKNFQRSIQTYYGDGSPAYKNPVRSNMIQRSTPTRTNNIRTLASYSRQLQNSNFNFLAGFEQQEYISETFQGYREDFILEDYQLLSLGSELNQQATGSAFDYSLRSYFGRFNYNYREKYLFEANLRYDGSSRFAEGKKYGLFPSFSAGWRISQEDFFNINDHFINEFKLRGSWGQLGNQQIGTYPFTSTVNLTQNYINNGVSIAGAAPTELGNPLISWETTEMINFGIDISMWHKLWITADFYRKDTDNILLRLPIPGIVGLTAPFQNAGKVRNTGWDLGITHHNRIGEFSFSATLSLADVKNEVIDLAGTGPYIDARTIIMEGHPINAFYGFETDGLFKTQEEIDQHATQWGTVAPGDIKYVDRSRSGHISSDEDRYVMGSHIPRYSFGLNLNTAYKGFDFTMFIQGVGKADHYRDQQGVFAFYVGNSAWEYHKETRWTPENPDASMPRLTINYPNNEQVSDFWLLNGAYLRLKNIQVGYTIPNSIIQRIFLDELRIYFSGQNLFTLDNYLKGFDVESPYGSGAFYPMVKTFTFGINTKF